MQTLRASPAVGAFVAVSVLLAALITRPASPALSATGAAPDGMVLIPGGAFLMGISRESIESEYRHLSPRVRAMLLAETPRHRVTVAAFYMDRFEVTNRQFQQFLDENPEWRPDRIDPKLHNGDYLKHWKNGSYQPEKADHPVVFVSWYAAMAFARWAEKRLPAEAEWEYAARGGLENAEYPWGNDAPSPKKANYAGSDRGDTVPVGSYPANGYGLHDMAGNVWEFTLDEWQDSYENFRDPRQTVAATLSSDWLKVITSRVIRGGSWGGAPVNLRGAFRDSHPPAGAGSHVGFRCVKSVIP
jgi:formylglycine-generating enzyme required for sulfatase activity